MIQINQLNKSFGTQKLFDKISFAVSKGERIGLVGRNGSGKSTLFNMIMQDLGPDEGEILIPKGYRIGALKQQIKFVKSNLLAECCTALPEEEKYDSYKAEKILFGIGFREDDLTKDPTTLSGGQQIRVNLAKLLLCDCDLLLLDEPSNYLDINGLRWLQRFLSTFPGEMILITHDRYFMDNVTTHTMGIVRRKIKKIKGSTEKFYNQIQMENEIHEKTRLNLERKRKEMEAFIERFRAKASKATQAQSRIKMLDRMGTLGKMVHEKNMGLHFRYSDFPAKTLMEIENLSFFYKKEVPLIENLTFSIEKNDRIAIIGQNGKGKSTLLNLLAQELRPRDGSIKIHPKTMIGHFGQTNINNLNENSSVVNEIFNSNPGLSTSKIRQICGSMLFSGDSALKKIKILSGGEKSRVLLGKILAHQTNLLLLDEPTNHLDIESVEIIVQQIEQYPGAVVLVTHSEELIRRLANKLIVFQNDRVEIFHGSYDDFLSKVGWACEDLSQITKKRNPSISKKEVKRRKSEIILERSQTIGPIKAQIESLELEIITLENQLKEKNQELIDSSKKGITEKIKILPKEIKAIENDIENAFSMLEKLESSYSEKQEKYNSLLLDLEKI